MAGFSRNGPAPGMLKKTKPKNARTKRVMDAREPKLIEPVKTAIFIKGTTTSDTVNRVMKDLQSFKRPDAVSYSKKNDIHPFVDASSLEFFHNKTDASLFMLANHNKKRPHNLVWARIFDGQILDMIETGVSFYKGLDEFEGMKSSIGAKPMFYFAGEQFDTHPIYKQFKSILVDFFHGVCTTNVNLAGLEYVISVTAAPFESGVMSSAAMDASGSENQTDLPPISFRVFKLDLQKSGTKVPRVELQEMGPSIDFVLRRWEAAEPEKMKQAQKRHKDIAQGTGKQVKNVEVNDMGDKMGRIHVGRQDLASLQTRKMKGLNAKFDPQDEIEPGDTDTIMA